jgi:hypothetical protein
MDEKLISDITGLSVDRIKAIKQDNLNKIIKKRPLINGRRLPDLNPGAFLAPDRTLQS